MQTINWMLLSFFGIVGLFKQQEYKDISTIVVTKNGTISGLEKNDVKYFLGVPFAKPPVGDLRWKEPQDLEKWAGVKKCTEFGLSPMQQRPRKSRVYTPEFEPQTLTYSEDCLYLNVWTKAKKKTDKKPVFVWIYGGAFMTGTSSSPMYNGENLAKKGVVFVSLNYRVGAFGFMSHPELTKESAHKVSGNYGFLDMIKALQWVRDNIEAFGGDPNNVTIAGQSSGSMSVNVLMSSPLAKGLFHKAIAMSGGMMGYQVPQLMKVNEERGMQLMDSVGAKSLAEFRKIPAEDIQKAVNKMGRFKPVRDDYVIPVDAVNRFKKGLHNDVPLITSWVPGDAHIGTTLVKIEKFDEEAAARFGASLNEFKAIFPYKDAETKLNALNLWNLLGTKAMASHLLGKYNSTTYLYEFRHIPPELEGNKSNGAFHGVDIGFALNNLKIWDKPWRKNDLDLSESMSNYFVTFAKTGNPNFKDAPNWALYNDKHRNIMVFDDSPTLNTDMYHAQFDFLEKYIDESKVY